MQPNRDTLEGVTLRAVIRDAIKAYEPRLRVDALIQGDRERLADFIAQRLDGAVRMYLAPTCEVCIEQETVTKHPSAVCRGHYDIVDAGLIEALESADRWKADALHAHGGMDAALADRNRFREAWDGMKRALALR